jgi:hypothetical protein
MKCYQGNHLLSGRTCQEQLAMYEDCMALHGGIGQKGSFMDAAAAFAKQCGAELEERKALVQDAWNDWVNRQR